MKQLKRGIAALLAGEFLALRHKDKTFKKNVQKASSPLDKIKVVFDGLFEFNKNIAHDIQEGNVQDMKNKAIARFSKESDHLEAKLDERENNFEQWSEEKLPIYMMGLDDQFVKYEKKALHWKEKLIDEYDLASKLEIFTNRLEIVRKNLQDKKSS